MSKKRSYLELTEYSGESHKFYEVVVEGATVSTRFGRIGTSGQSSTKKFPSAEAALVDAEKKLSAKRRKGYADAVQGARQARAVLSAGRSADSRETAALPGPLLWAFDTSPDEPVSDRALNVAEALHVDDAGCWIGNSRGQVFQVSHDGAQCRSMAVDDSMVMVLVPDGDWLYACCRGSGKVFELSGPAPVLSYEVPAKLGMLWMDLNDGRLAVSTVPGDVLCYDHDDMEQVLWAARGPGSDAWMVRCDADGVYVGDSAGVACFDHNGVRRWHASTGDKGREVLFGWQDTKAVYAGTRRASVMRFRKTDGSLLGEYKCLDKVVSCAASPDGKFVFAGDARGVVYCFDADSAELKWRFSLDCGAAYVMQLFGERLFVSTSSGVLGCIDVSEKAVAAALNGTTPPCKLTRAVASEELKQTMASLKDLPNVDHGVETGVVVKCVSQGSKLRVLVDTEHPSGKDFKADWFVQFPRNLREAGRRFVVDELREGRRGGFYRSLGSVKLLS